MPKYCVMVEWRKGKEVTVYAKNEDEAEEKALDLVASWGVDDPEVTDVSEE